MEKYFLITFLPIADCCGNLVTCDSKNSGYSCSSCIYCVGQGAGTFGSDMGRGGGVKKCEFWSKIQKYKGTFGTTNYPCKNYISILNLW